MVQRSFYPCYHYNKDCNLESCIQVDEFKTGNEFKQFGGFLALIAIHVGKNEEVVQTHVKNIRWLKQQGYLIDGPISEEYIISPVDNKHITKIIIPIKKAK